MLDYNAIWEPYAGDGCTIEKTRTWLKRTWQLDDSIIHQAIMTVLNEVAEGANFQSECKCGCSNGDIHNQINHRMRDLAIDLQKKATEAYESVIIGYEQSRVSTELARISNFNKEYIKMKQKELPLKDRLTFWGAVTRLCLWKVW